jgi:hypothetical protein
MTRANRACDALYKAGYNAAKQEKDYDPRSCKEWQTCVDLIKHVCQAKQYSDQMHCVLCDLTWDMNDYEPPACEFTINLQNC